MMQFSKIRSIGFIKTLWFNFRYLPFRQAVKLPFILASNVRIGACRRGFCEFSGGGRRGGITIGFNRSRNSGNATFVSFQGKLIIHGEGIHAFGAGCYISVAPEAVLEVGNNFGCTGDTQFRISHHTIIGDDNLWSYGCVVMDSDSHSIYNEAGVVVNRPRPIVFGNHIWMGCNCLILKGTTVPSNNIIAAGSRLSQIISAERSIIVSGGKVLKEHVSWDARVPQAL